jgi:hypothetical protein
MAITLAADLANGQIAMVGEARFTIEQQTPAAALFNKKVLEKGSKSLFLPKWGKVTAKDLTDGVDMTEAQSLSMSGTTATTSEAGCKVIITKKLANQLNADAFRDAGTIIGNAMAKKIDTECVALFSGLSGVIGSASTSFSIAYAQAAATQVNGQDEPVPDPIQFMLHPYTYHDIKTNLSQPGTSMLPPSMQEPALKNKWRGNEPLYGYPIYVDQNITSGTSCYGALFSKYAFIYIVGWEPETWMEYDSSLRGWELGVVTDFDTVEDDDTYGRALLFDASVPTS